MDSLVRAGSTVLPDSKMVDLDRGEALPTHLVSGKEVNALGYYSTRTDPSRWRKVNRCECVWRNYMSMRWSTRWMVANFCGSARWAGR